MAVVKAPAGERNKGRWKVQQIPWSCAGHGGKVKMHSNAYIVHLITASAHVLGKLRGRSFGLHVNSELSCPIYYKALPLVQNVQGMLQKEFLCGSEMITVISHSG